MHTPQTLADYLGVDKDKVLAWIRDGQLRAINVSTKTDSKKPRWRITERAIAEFEAMRSSVPERKPARRKQPEVVRNWV